MRSVVPLLLASTLSLACSTNHHHSGRQVTPEVPDSLHAKVRGAILLHMAILHSRIWREEPERLVDAAGDSLGALIAAIPQLRGVSPISLRDLAIDVTSAPEDDGLTKRVFLTTGARLDWDGPEDLREIEIQVVHRHVEAWRIGGFSVESCYPTRIMINAQDYRTEPFR